MTDQTTAQEALLTMLKEDGKAIIESSQSIKHCLCPGIYYLIKDSEIVYIGQSTNMFNRIGSHATAGKKDFDSFYTKPLPRDQLYHHEVREILKHRPRYNKTLPSNKTYANIHTLRVDFQMTVNELLAIIKRHGINSEWICNQNVYKREEIRNAIS